MPACKRLLILATLCLAPAAWAAGGDVGEAQKLYSYTDYDGSLKLLLNREPKTAELKGWFEKNKAMFAQPSRVSFRHLYFSPDRRGNHARDDAATALAGLAGQPQDAKLAATLADPFMFQDFYRDRAPDYLGKEFGPQFAQTVAKLAPGSWQGPI